MTINKLCSVLAKREGKKKPISIGNAREVVGIVSDLLYEDFLDSNRLHGKLIRNGAKRAKKK